MRLVLLFILILLSTSLQAQWKTCDCCCPADADYRLYNVGGANAGRVVSWENENRVWVNNTLIGELDKNDVFELSLAKGDIIYSCEPLFGSGELGSSSRSLMPDYMASDVLGATASRGGGIDLDIFSLGATSADIYRNNVLITTIALTPNTVSTYTQVGAYTGYWKVIANGQILGHKGDDNGGTTDNSIMTKPSNDLLGWASTGAYIGREDAGANVPFTVYSHLGNHSNVVSGTTYNLVNSGDLPHNGSQDNYYDPLVNIRVQSLQGIFGNSRADSDGGDDTALMPTDLLTTHHKIPQPSEYVSISNLGGAPIQVFDENGVLVTTLTPTKINADPLAPYGVRYGTPNGTTNIPLGYEFVSIEGIAVVYQPKNAGTFGSDDDEINSLGLNL